MAHPRNRQFLFPLRSATALGVALALVAGCGSDDDNSPGERSATVQFKAEVNGQDFVCGKTYSNVGVGQPGTYQVNDWRFYVHDVALVKADGSRQEIDLDQDGVWQYQNTVLLDLRKDCGSGTLPTNAVVKGSVPNENYAGLCFKVGVPYSAQPYQRRHRALAAERLPGCCGTGGAGASSSVWTVLVRPAATTAWRS
ncbi:MAG: hypothetical protein IPL59_16245 [Candidatus Competibacteraceae bacterium]|nr:hypothetical protein [Candidatus Competibacteraceae bacterium]